MARPKKDVVSEEVENNEVESEKSKNKKTNNLLDMLMKNSSNKFISTVTDSKYFNKTEEDVISTPIPMINVALNGRVDGGISGGITIIAGESRRYKTLFGIIMAAAFLEKYKDGVVLFYDSEIGSNLNYFETYGADTSRIVHIPTNTVEDLTHEITKQFDMLKKQDNTSNKVFILVDSLGQMASRKEVEDSLTGSEKADLTRAKKIKSLFRIITLDSVLLSVPTVIINHTYNTQEFISKTIISGGTGGMLAANAAWIIGKRQIKDGDEKAGNEFVIKLEKSRFCKEGSNIPISVYFDRGIAKYSGFSELAVEFGIVEEIKIGKNKGLKFGDIEILEKENDFNEDFWENIIANTELCSKIEEKYLL